MTFKCTAKIKYMYSNLLNIGHVLRKLPAVTGSEMPTTMNELLVIIRVRIPGADPGFQAKGGGGGGGRAERGAKIVGVFRVKNQNFTPKNHIFSNGGGWGENFWGISCEKSRFYAKKSFFPFLGGGRPPPPPPSGFAPVEVWCLTPL